MIERVGKIQWPDVRLAEGTRWAAGERVAPEGWRTRAGLEPAQRPAPLGWLNRCSYPILVVGMPMPDEAHPELDNAEDGKGYGR